MKTIPACLRLASAVLLVPAAATANDPWDASPLNDNTAATSNALLPGDRQVHDLESPGVGLHDGDMFLAYGHAGHSYEARITGFSTPVSLLDVDPTQTTYRREDSFGNLVQNSVCRPHPIQPVCVERTLAYIVPADGFTFLRVLGPPSAPSSYQYTMEFFDTSYSVPRFNNSATQTTVFLMQNLTTSALSGSIVFSNSAGIAIGTGSLNIAPAGVQVLNTTTVAGVAGQSGSALISHDGPYGALNGKAVSLEPATGFTFDTPLTPVTQ